MRSIVRISAQTLLIATIAAGAFIVGRMSGAGARRPQPDGTAARLDDLEEQLGARMERLERLIVSSATTIAQRRTGDCPSVASATQPQGDRAAAAQPEAKAPEPTAENQRAFATAQRLVDDALTKRVWGERERDELMAQLSQTTGQQRLEVVNRLVLAINGGQIKPTAVPPF